MRIRTQLLLFILPPITALVLIVSYFCYVTWHKEALKNFRSTLQGITVASAQIIDPRDCQWLIEHMNEKTVTDSAIYKKYIRSLTTICKLLPISSIYLVEVSPVAPGELPLLNQPESSKNQPYEGNNPQLAYRQRYILDIGAPGEPLHTPGSYGFSDSGEFRVYLTKKPYISRIYEGRESGMRYMTGYAPLMNEQGAVVGLLGADLRLEVLDKKAQEIQGVIVLVALITIVCTTAGIIFIAEKLSNPVEELKNAALAIAGGMAGKTIEVEGPLEITELANALNTMSVCMRENMIRLEEASFVREKLLEHKECFRILQDKIISDTLSGFTHPHIRTQAIDMPGKEEGKPVLIEFSDSGPDHLVVTFKESAKKGLDGIINLLRSHQISHRLMLSLNREDTGWKLECTTAHMPKPLVWSTHKQQLYSATEETLYPGDFIVLVNNNLYTVMSRDEIVHNWFSRAFYHFANEGIEACMSALKNEFLFLAKKQRFTSSLQLICLEIF